MTTPTSHRFVDFAAFVEVVFVDFPALGAFDAALTDLANAVTFDAALTDLTEAVAFDAALTDFVETVAVEFDLAALVDFALLLLSSSDPSPSNPASRIGADNKTNIVQRT
eukprot:15090404-Ditylum_brightwellii.AAC.1